MEFNNKNEQFLDLLRSGDKNARTQFVRDNQKNIFGLAFRMTGNRDDALDITQETFMKALKNIKKFRGDSLISTWLYTIAANLSRDYLRRNSRRTFVEIDDNTVSADSRSPLSILEERDKRLFVRKALMALPPKTRVAFSLRFEKGLPISEIAKVLKKSEGTIKAQLHNAVYKIKSLLED
ncbi:sigma-70 family RNA polymerase sigma factor [bacterium]|nr:sigma-70 family RNA polymerase sigma factor [bacterium]